MIKSICSRLNTARGISVLLAGIVLSLQTTQARASDTLVEIFFLPHRPALEVVSQVEKVVAEFDGMVVKKYGFDDPAAADLLEKYELTGHMPIAIFINGTDRFTIGGRQVQLRNFNRGNTFVPQFTGAWDYEDLRAILRDVSGQQ